jgi:hypothetical protein
MAYVIAEPCIGTKDTACADACPVDRIHPKKMTVVRASMRSPSSILIPWNASIVALACRSVRSPRFLRWMTFPKSGSTTQNLMQATSKTANSRQKNMPSTRRSRNQEGQMPVLQERDDDETHRQD